MKNEKGKWETIFNGTRIAKGRFTITNTCTGGDYALYELVYPELINQYPFMKVPTADELDEVTIMLAEYIEKELGDLGEVGMDIGIDIKGRIWIFEANARPDKEIDPTILDMSGVPWVDLVPNFYKGYLHNKKIQPQSLGIFKYSKFLAGIK
jgi:hypothetical protein